MKRFYIIETDGTCNQVKQVDDSYKPLENEIDELVCGNPNGLGLYLPLWNGTEWIEGKDQTELLQQAKDSKIAELDNACNQTIENGFDHDINGVSYHFFLPITAQSNFQGARAQFKDGKITVARWTVLNNVTGEFERIDLDWLTFEPIADKVFDIVDSNIKKLRDDLELRVNAAYNNGDLEGIKSITWDMV